MVVLMNTNAALAAVRAMDNCAAPLQRCCALLLALTEHQQFPHQFSLMEQSALCKQTLTSLQIHKQKRHHRT